MTQDKSIIYVNGCSFTEGCDMADHMYPFFEKYYSLNEIRLEDLKVRERKQAAALKQKYKFNDTLANESLVQSIFEFERNSRWSNKLADKLGRSVYNLSSQGGTSMYAIGHRTMADLHVLQHQGYTITDIIIQVTAPGRYSFFAPTIVQQEPQRKVNDRYYHLNTGSHTNPGPFRQDLIESILYAESWEMTEYRWLHDLYMLKHAIQSITNCRVILVDSIFYIKNIAGISNNFNFRNSSWLKKNSQDYLLDFKKTLDEELKLSMLDVIDPDEPDTVTNGMHFTAKVHERFAELIARTYFND
jgi:hypothetical protein